MAIAIVTGASGLVGAETVRVLADKGLEVVGIDNNMRRELFGDAAGTGFMRTRLEQEVPGYIHHAIDIRDREAITGLIRRYGTMVEAVVHAAAQPSLHWSARDPFADFTINATGTLVLLDAVRRFCPEAAFAYLSSTKVYGDHPNRLPLAEEDSRFELPLDHPWGEYGIDETMPVDHASHNLFGTSKLSADLLVQEYGRHFGMPTGCFRAGAVTGGGHAGAEMHGFLAWMVRCAVEGRQFTLFGHSGKQVRDVLHANDLANALGAFIEAPEPGAVYNIGGGREVNISLLEAVRAVEDMTGEIVHTRISETPRPADQMWWISDTRSFLEAYPHWVPAFDMESIIADVYDGVLARQHGG